MAFRIWQYTKSALKWTIFLPITIISIITQRLWRLVPSKIRSFMKYAFLLTLPFTIFPFLDGVIHGSLFAGFSLDKLPQAGVNWNTEQERRSWMNYFNMPGSGLSIHDFKDLKPFASVPTLKSTDWWTKLGFLKPAEDTGSDSGIDRLAALDGLVQVKGASALRSPGLTPQPGPQIKEAWVYITWFPMVDIKSDWIDEKTNFTHFERRMHKNSWDEAFDELVRYSYAHPLTYGNNTKLFYLDTIDSPFLSDLWSIKRPSLLHFFVKEDWTDADSRPDSYLYPAWWIYENETRTRKWTQHGSLELELDELRPVSVRSIDLPLEHMEHALDKDDGRIAFPSEFEQLKSIIYNRDAWNAWPEYEFTIEAMNRFREDVEDRLEFRYKSMKVVGRAKRWLRKNIFDQTELSATAYEYIQGTFLGLSWVIGALLWVLRNMGDALVKWFLGLPLLSEEGQLSHLYKGFLGMEPRGGSNFMEDMFLGAMEKMMTDIDASVTDGATKSQITEAIRNIVPSVFAGTSTSMSTSGI